MAMCLLLVAVMGCGKKGEVEVVPMRGEVFFGDQPAAGALVVLHPREESGAIDWTRGYPHGVVAEDGSFEVTAPPFGDGAPEGEYKVVITWLVPAPNTDPDDPEPELVDRLQGRWADPLKSSVTALVKAPEVQLPRIEVR